MGDSGVYTVIELSVLPHLVLDQFGPQVLANNSGNEMADCPWPGRFAPSCGSNRPLDGITT
ncbi:MAG: hypothetical protein EBZ13_04625 [Planctomycetia bacterium]|nr:hypothetical protein [Planctomycetia bacterium]